MYRLIVFIEKIFKFIRIKSKIFYWKLKYGKRIKIGKNFKFRKSLVINISNNGYLEIGNNCFFNNFCSINCHKKIIIGDDNIFGEGVKIYDHNHLFNNKTIDMKTNFKEHEIYIGNNNWFGSNVILLSKTELSNYNVVGAGCIINQKYDSEKLIQEVSEKSINKINYTK